MARLIILGTASAIPAVGRENTHMALETQNGVILVDCVGSPAVRLAQANLAINDINDVILTHFHPDHVSGIPILLMNMWLLGRRTELRIHALDHCLERVQSMMALYSWHKWPSFFPVRFSTIPASEGTLVIENRDVRILASPVRHLIPTIGLRFNSSHGHTEIAYSCDTEPCPAVARLASGVDLLIHEATGAGSGHSSASQAGSIAREAQASELLLIHFDAAHANPDALIRQAQETFPGKVGLTSDFMEFRM